MIGSGFDDSMTVQGTSADMPVQTAPDTVVVHGTAADPQGNQLPVTGLEARGVFTNAAANESTISQNPAAPGPSAPCVAPPPRAR